ncbi:hypothetical protein HHL25_01065 [Rhizobium sp. S-51]|uniref:Uncharacterized protein n=1 Tax=Rhizobium terricola TaxID=2728849 RepID=A0A7Y0FUB9_9HYPH|nr:hypothetical protein [Rhizobium terricola]NML72705.1 hypothetical protein [Rhizobium terricola]
MTVVKEFDHDGSHFRIAKSSIGENWEYKIFCDSAQIGSIITASVEVVADASRQGYNVDEIVGTELEGAVKNIFGFQTKLKRPSGT